MRADFMAFISLMFGAIVVLILVRHYQGVVAETNASTKGVSRIVRAYGA